MNELVAKARLTAWAGVVMIFVMLVLSACIPLAPVPAAPTAPPAAVTATSAPQRAVVAAATATLAPTIAPATVTPAAAPVAGSPRPVVIAIPDEPPSFNAAIVATGYDTLVMHLVLLRMVRTDPEGNIQPQLAANLPTVENGGVSVDEAANTMTVTWELRKGVAWADGKPVTADDVIFTYNAITKPEMQASLPGFDLIENVEKVDEAHVKVHYSSIYPSYLTQFGNEWTAIWPAHYCDITQGFPQWDCARKPLSNGPFILDSWQSGDRLSFRRNPTYYEPGKPAIDRLIVRIVPDAAVRATMLEKGDADVLPWINETTADELKSSRAGVVSVAKQDRYVMHLWFNHASRGETDPVAHPHPVLSDVRVRRAIRMAIDVGPIVRDVYRGYSTPVWTEFFRMPEACGIPQPKFDATAAVGLLEEAGWKDTDGDGVRECRGCQTARDGDPMSLELIAYSEAGEALQLAQQLIAEDLKKVGIEVKLSSIEGAVLWATTADGGIEPSGKWDMTLWDTGYTGQDPTDFLRDRYSAAAAVPDKGTNYGRFINSRFDELLDEAVTLDAKKQMAAFCEMARILEDNVPNAPLYSTFNADAHSNRLQGPASNINDLITWNVADWTLK